MKVEYFPAISELSLWLAWNDALDAGEIPVEDSRGTQFLGLGGSDSLMSVRMGPHGPDVRIYREETIRATYAKDGNPENLALKRTKKPLRLE